MIKALPPLWLLILIAGLPQVSETIYSPSLPDIAHSLAVPDSWVEYTLTIYLAGFAVGTLFWGKLSDRLGRKPCLLIGIAVFILGCVGCYFSTSITQLMISRFLQSFGGSTGSVLGQAITRDVFRGVERGKVYSTVAAALFLSPAIGPFIGGAIDQFFGWTSIFLVLMIAGILVFLSTMFKLPETHSNRTASTSLSKIARNLIRDKHVLGYGLVVAAANGIHFSYYAEGPFYLIDLLGLSPSVYGLTFIGFGFMGILGAWLSRTLHQYFSSKSILWKGILIQLSAVSFFLIATLTLEIFPLPPLISIIVTVGSMATLSAGTAMIVPNCLSLALEDYQHAVGTASSLFGFFYYTLASLMTLFMGLLHNDTKYSMPLYFFGIVLLILVVFLQFINKEEKKELKVPTPSVA
jgi:Bcr/CflA subfamily drug resistance transporter